MIHATYRAGRSFITIELANTPKVKTGFQVANATAHLENAIKKHYRECLGLHETTSLESGRIGVEFTVRVRVRDDNNDYLWAVANIIRSFVRGLDPDIKVVLE